MSTYLFLAVSDLFFSAILRADVAFVHPCDSYWVAMESVVNEALFVAASDLLALDGNADLALDPETMPAVDYRNADQLHLSKGEYMR